MGTKTLTKVKVLSLVLVLVFIFTGCGPKATFKNPDDAVEHFLNGENVVGLTILVHTNTDKDVVEFENKLGIIYSEGYKGSFMKKVVIFLNEGNSFEAGHAYAVKIESIRETRTGDIYIDGDIVS